MCLLNYVNLFFRIQSFFENMLPEIECGRITGEIGAEHEYQGIRDNVFVDCK